ncbi:hypothetical protein [Streptomyces sp. NPDC058548]|uniref:hypothetical protein n=1 Tax=Streptomyces sp. NPDC058548 TaxID=3346545 RepID=UPI0036485CEE
MRKRSGRPPRFAQVPNESVDDSPNLDLTALGLLTVFLRHKDGWDITLADVGKKYGYGEDAMAGAMGLLQVARYVVKVRVMGAGNQWRTEMAVFAPPARDDEVEELLATIREEGVDVRRVEVIPPTATAIKKAQKRREKLARTGGARLRENPDSGPTCGNTASSQVGPDSGFSRDPENPRVSKKTVSKKTTKEDKDAGPDAVGKGAGGFERASSSAGAAGETGEAGSGSAASEPKLPTQRKTSPRPATVKTRPRRESARFEMVRAALPAAVAAPGTKLWVGLHRAINDLLDGGPGIPRRTPEQVVARINRRWCGENADLRSAAGYAGDDRIRNRCSWLAAAILAQDCPDPSCEDGEILGGGGACKACRMRREEDRKAAEAAAELLASLVAGEEVFGAARVALDAWTACESAEERTIRQRLGESGMYGQLLDHRVGQHMAGWHERNPRPAVPAARRNNDRQAVGT